MNIKLLVTTHKADLPVFFGLVVFSSFNPDIGYLSFNIFFLNIGVIGLFKTSE